MNDTEEATVVIHVRLPKTTHAALTAAAKAQRFDMPVTTLARGLIEEGLGLKKGKIR